MQKKTTDHLGRCDRVTEKYGATAILPAELLGRDLRMAADDLLSTGQQTSEVVLHAKGIYLELIIKINKKIG